MNRYRITFAKFGPLRYISHLELQRVWTRILLRAKIPVSYTQGFHPTVKMGVAWPLPLGWTGLNELIDFWFDYPAENGEDPTTDELTDRINRNCPEGLRVVSIEKLLPFGNALTVIIQTADYIVDVDPEHASADLFDRITALFNRETIERVRRKKTYDLRPLMLGWEPRGGNSFFLRMSARDSAMGRPDELIAELGLDPLDASYTRLSFGLDDSPENAPHSGTTPKRKTETSNESETGSINAVS